MKHSGEGGGEQLLKRNMVTTCGVQMWALFPNFLYTNKIKKLSSLSLQDRNAVLCKSEPELSEIQTFASPWCFCFSLMLLLLSCSPVVSRQSSRVASRHVLHSLIGDGWQHGRHLPSTLAQQGVASHSLIVNCKVGWEGHSHTLTHWQLHSAHWDIISQTVEGWCSHCGFSFGNSHLQYVHL